MKNYLFLKRFLASLLFCAVSVLSWAWNHDGTSGLEFRISSTTNRTVYVSGVYSPTTLNRAVIPSKVVDSDTGVEYTVTGIGSYAFCDCSILTSITIPNTVTKIDEYAFMNCSSLKSLTIPNSVKSIGLRAFYNCSITSLTIPNSVTTIGVYAFEGCSSLKSVTLPNTIKSIENGTFYGCSSLTSITIPNSVTSIGVSAFEGCSKLTSVTLPNTIKSIESNTFYGCSSLTSITIPNSVQVIDGWAFKYCSKLTSVTISSSVYSVYYAAFEGCSSLKSVICLAETVPSYAWYSFSANVYPKNATLYVPLSALDEYKNSTEAWGQFRQIMPLETNGCLDFDQTPMFSTEWQEWDGATGYASAESAPMVETLDGRSVQVCENFAYSTADGKVLSRTLTGLPNGMCRISLYAGAACTGKRDNVNGKSSWEYDGNMTVAYMQAKTSKGTYKKYIPIYFETDFNDRLTKVDLWANVTDGTVELEMYSKGNYTNWHVAQLCGVASYIIAEDYFTDLMRQIYGILTGEEYSVVTGTERAALVQAYNDNITLSGATEEEYMDAINSLSASLNEFKAAKDSYAALVAVKAMVDGRTYQYASQEKIDAAEAAAAAVPESAAEAAEMSEALLKAYRQYAESHAMLEYLPSATDMTSYIKNPKREEAIDPAVWQTVLGEGSGGSIDFRDDEPWTDGSGNATHRYFDGGDRESSSWDLTFKQDISLPAGRYLLSAMGRSEVDVEMTLFAGDATAEMAHIGSSGLFNNGWEQTSVEFELQDAATVSIGVRGVASAIHNWMSFSDFRLVQFTPAPAPVYTVHIADCENGTVTTDVSEAKAGDTVTITFTPDKYYGLDDFGVLNVADNSPISISANAFIMPESDVKVYATFKDISYSIEIIKIVDNPHGTIATDVSRAEAGDTVSLFITPDEGYELESVFITDATEEIRPDLHISSKDYTFIMPEANMIIWATFRKIVYYSIEIDDVHNGTITAGVSSSKPYYTIGLTITPDEGYELESLTVHNVADDIYLDVNPFDPTYYTFTMPESDVVIRGSFKKIPGPYYSIEIADVQNGTVTSDVSEARAGDTVTLTITPDEGCELRTLNVLNVADADIFIPVAIGSNFGDFTMPESDVVIRAEFRKIVYYSIEIDDVQNGTITADVSSSKTGHTIFLTVTPSEGYELESLTVLNVADDISIPVNVINVSSATYYIFTMPESDVVIWGTFRPSIPDTPKLPVVKMTYVDYANPDTPVGEVEVAKAGYNKISNGEVGFGNVGWGCNWVTYISVDASGIDGVAIKSATLTAEVSGSTDSNRSTTWGVGYNTSVWSADMTYSTADKTITQTGTEFKTSTKYADVFETVTFDITDAFSEGNRTATILVYETAAAGGYIRNVHVDFETADSELDAAKERALAAVKSLPAGDGLFRYPQSSIDAAIAAIEAAQTVEEVEAVEMPAMTLPAADQAYLLSLSTSEGTFRLNTEDGIKIAEEGTPVFFVAQANGTYALATANGEYVNYEGGDTWTLAATSEAYGWTIAALADGGYTLTGKNGFLGTNTSDGNDAGSACYGDKKIDNGNYIWNIEETEIPAPLPDGIDALGADAVKANGKYLENGKVVIYRNGMKYGSNGSVVK